MGGIDRQKPFQSMKEHKKKPERSCIYTVTQIDRRPGGEGKRERKNRGGGSGSYGNQRKNAKK